MASASGVRAGSAYVEATVKDLTKGGLDAIEKRLKGMGTTISQFGRGVLTAGVAMATGFGVAIKFASDLQETVNKFRVVFGAQAEDVEKWGETFRKAVGRNKREVLEFLSTTRATLIPFNFDSKSMTEMSPNLTALAVDLASFYNISDEAAFEKIQAGLVGEMKPLKELGVIVNETAVKMEMLSRGLDPKNATEAEKVISRYNIILRDTKIAHGDAIRTAGSFANQFKRLRSEAIDAAGAIGNAVLPVATQWVSAAAQAAVAAGQWASRNQSLFQMLMKVTVALIAFGATAFVIGKVMIVASALITVFKGLVVAMALVKVAGLALLATPWGIALAAIAAVAGAVTLAMINQADSIETVNTMYDQLLAKGDQQRAADQAAIARLQKLTQLNDLSAAQQQEACDIINTLNGRYTQLGLTFNSTTKRIGGLVEAMNKLNAANRSSAEEDLLANIFETDAKISHRQEDMRDPSNWKYGVDVGTKIGSLGFSGTDMVGDEIRAASDDIAKLFDKRNDLMARLKALRGGDITAAVGPIKKDDPDTAAKKAADLTEEQLKEQAKLQKDLIDLKRQTADADELRSSTEINQRYDAEVAKVQAVAAVTRAEETKKTADLAALENSRQAELAAIARKAVDEKLAAELEAIDLKYKAEEERLKKLGMNTDALKKLQEGDQVEAIVKANAARAAADRDASKASQDRAEKERDNVKEQADLKEERALALLELQKQAADAEAEVADKNKDKTGGENKRMEALKLQQQIDRINFEKQAKALGLSDKQLAEMRSLLDAVQKSQTAAAKPEKVFGQAGTFNAYAAQSLRGSSSADRAAKAAEEIARSNKQVEKNTKEMVKKPSGIVVR